MENRKVLALLDGNALIHRAFHAIPPFLSTATGEQTNAVYGFSSVLIEILQSMKPDCFVVAFDKKGPTFRHTEYTEYKATRTKAPDELYAQIPRIRQVVEAFDIPIFEIDGFEADDVIGTLSVQAVQHGMNVVIVTGDMDALQLVNEHVTVATMHKGFKETITYNPDAVIAKYGLTPEQVVDYKAIRGDASDNIKGVPGIGEKGAVKLLQEYGTLDNIYENLDKITGSVHDKLAANKEQAYFSQRLARIVLDVPVTLDMIKCHAHEFDKETVAKLFTELEFRSLIKRLDKLTLKVQIAKRGTVPTQATLF